MYTVIIRCTVYVCTCVRTHVRPGNHPCVSGRLKHPHLVRWGKPWGGHPGGFPGVSTTPLFKSLLKGTYVRAYVHMYIHIPYTAYRAHI